MLGIVYNSGRCAFETFIEVLQQAGYQELAQKLTVDLKKKRTDPPGFEIEVLSDNHERLVDELDSSVLKNYLFQNKLIDEDDLKKINKEYRRSTRDGADELLNIIYNSGSDAFLGLMKSLAEAGYKDWSSKLLIDFNQKRTDPSSSNLTKERGRLSGIEFGVLRDNHERLVDELDSSVLKNHLFQNKLIDEDDLEKITKKEEEHRREGAEEMLIMIYNSGSDGFLGLLKSLVKARYGKLGSKLFSDFNQKKDMLAFPDDPVIPELVVGESVMETLTNIEAYHEVWCFTMRDWFRIHKFKNGDELKMVVKHWLCKLEEVIEKGCLGFNLLIAFAEQSKDPYRTKILQDLKGYILNMTPKEDFEPKSINALLHKQQRRFFEILKHNLEGIIEGKQNFEILPIDTESIGLDDHFQSVVYDVREIWNKLHEDQDRLLYGLIHLIH